MSALRLSRKKSLAAVFSRFPVVMDGETIAEIGNGETATYNVEPGRHTVYIKGVAWGSSKELVLDVAAGEVKTLECGVKPPLTLAMVAAWAAAALGARFLPPVFALALFVLWVVVCVKQSPWGLLGSDAYYLKERGAANRNR